MDDPVGPDNDRWLTGRWDEAGRLGLVVVAGGSGRYPILRGRADHAARLLTPMNPWCLRVGRHGDPLHPLYQEVI